MYTFSWKFNQRERYARISENVKEMSKKCQKGIIEDILLMHQTADEIVKLESIVHH